MTYEIRTARYTPPVEGVEEMVVPALLDTDTNEFAPFAKEGSPALAQLLLMFNPEGRSRFKWIPVDLLTKEGGTLS